MSYRFALNYVAATICALSCTVSVVGAQTRAENQDFGKTHTPAKRAAAQKQIKAVAAQSNNQLQALTQPAPITGFHPIKKITQPIKNLEDTADRLNQDASNLRGPMNHLVEPMLSLQQHMHRVDKHVTTMQTDISGTEKQVEGARSDLEDVRRDIQSLKDPVTALRRPMEKVAGPIVALEWQLNFIITAILIASVGTAFGTPLMFMLLFKYRDKFLPGLSSHLKRSQKKQRIAELRQEKQLAETAGS